MINVASKNNRVLIAVSSGPTITDSSSFTFFYFQQNTVSPAGNNNQFADYPTLGVDANALYIGVNMFGAKYAGTTGFVVRKSSVTSGGPIVVTAFRSLCGASTVGPYTPQGVDNDDPGATEGYFIGVDNAYYGLLQIRRITNPGGTPSISGNISLTVPTTTAPLDPTVRGGTNPTDAIDDRLFAAAIHRNKLTGVSSLWTAHNIQVDASGVASSSGGRDGSRWYEIQGMTGTPTLVQSGTLFDSAGSNPASFWMPSTMMSGQGHMALACSKAGANEYAEIAAAGRLSGDPAGTLQSYTLAQSSSTSYNIGLQNGVYRWGDYSQTVVDPNDDMTMWTFQEYCNTTDSWGVRAIQLIAPPPATPSSASPSTLCLGQTSVNVTITGTSTSGSGFFDPGSDPGGPGFANHISASVSGTGVTVNSISFTDPTHVTLNLSVDSGASTGTRNVTITNPDGQSATGTALLTIAAAPAAVSSSGLQYCAGRQDCLTWPSVSGATSYNVYRGDSSTLGNPLTGCLRFSTAGTTTGNILAEAPSAGNFYWYLVTAVAGACEGSSGDATSGPRSLNSSGGCP
jgi:hypothetical protein